MLSSIRRFGVSSALRASVPRSTSARCAAHLPKWQAPSTLSSLSATRSLHCSFPRFSAAAAEAPAQETESKQQRFTEFADLDSQGVIHKSVMRNILEKDRMNLKTMTEVQSLTLQEIVKGDDV